MKTIIKNTKQTIVSVIGISCVLFSVNSYSLDYVEDAKQYLEKGETSAAIIQLKNQLKSNPGDAQARFLLGMTYFKIGELLQADKEMARAVALDSDNTQMKLNYAEILLATKDYKKLQPLLTKTYTSANDESRRLVYLGYLFLAERKFSDAKIHFEKSNQHNENSQAYNGLAKIAFIEKEYELVTSNIEKSLQIEIDNKEALLLQAKLFNIQKKYTQALELYNQLIKKNKNLVQLYAERIATYIVLQQFDDAERDIAAAFRLSPNNQQITYLYAQVMLYKKDFEASRNASEKILAVRDSHYPSMLLLGVAHYGLQNYNQADKYLTQYLSIKPDDISAQNMLANVYLSQRKPEQALLMLENFEQSEINSNPSLLLTMGSAYLLNGELKKGMLFLKRAQLLAPKNKEIQKRMITGHIQAGEMEQAITNLESLADSNSSTKQYKYLLIISYIQKKELKKAAQKLNRMIQNDDKDPGLYNLRAVINKLNRDNQKAIESYNKALSLNPDFIPAYIGLAQFALMEKDIEKAKNYYKKVIQIKKDYTRVYYALAAIAIQQKRPDQAEKILLEAYHNAKNVEDKVKAAIKISKLYARQKQPEKLLSLANELNRNYPENTAVMSFSAGVKMANQQIDEALIILRKIILNKPLDIKHRILLAKLLTDKQGKTQEIIKLYDEVIAIQPDQPTGMALKAAYLLKLKQYKESLSIAEKIMQTFSDKAIGYKLKGDVLLTQKKYKRALRAYQSAYEIEPDNKQLYLIADLMKAQKQGKEAIDLLLSELEKNNKNTGILFKLASIHQQQKNTDKAVYYYKKMLEMEPNNILALNNLAGIYLTQDNPEALLLAKKAYHQLPDSAAIIDTYGYAQIKMGDRQEGIQLLEKSVELSAKSYDMSFHLAEAYYLNGDKAKAKRLLKPLLTNKVKFSEKRKAEDLFRKLQ